MKLSKISLILFTVVLFNKVTAQHESTYTKGNLSISFINEDPDLKTGTEDKFINTVFKVYPKLLKKFNSSALKDITIKIDTAYTGVAYCSGGSITVSAAWLKKKPTDIDLITHEVMHIIQAYPNEGGPVWLSEGVADYVRYKFGVDNEEAGWSLPDFNASQHYTNSYRVTARFLVWVSDHYNKKLVYILDDQMRTKTYTENSWNDLTGKSVDELWQEYSSNPKI
ncbi:basic secretory protein-like protein [Robertkochia solimangrovi]|uniref:basic secretory protein-like protein n=1 Tax=Robertkochia solimangrovi TaxID=2213046 RepID=UPI0011811B14|nr:basic secretory protein-like protein [Robertkochia solimangrovi]TRZ41279.1 secretory protein [Robertkochia solimangrovi]